MYIIVTFYFILLVVDVYVSLVMLSLVSVEVNNCSFKTAPLNCSDN